MPAVETQPEMSYEGKKDMMAGKKMDKKDMKEYKNPVKADHSDHSDKAAKGAVPTVGGAKVKTGASGSNMTSTSDRLEQVASTSSKDRQHLRKWLVNLKTQVEKLEVPLLKKRHPKRQQLTYQKNLQNLQSQASNC